MTVDVAAGIQMKLGRKGSLAVWSKDEAREVIMAEVDRYLNSKYQENPLEIRVEKKWTLPPSEFTLAARECETA